MTNNFNEFSAALGNESAVARDDLVKQQRFIALEALTGVVFTTPVDTGRARANWNVTFNVTTDATTEDTDKEGGATVARGSAQINAVDKLGVIWMQNALEYIEALENGSSKQSPSGMVQVTLNRLENVGAA